MKQTRPALISLTDAIYGSMRPSNSPKQNNLAWVVKRSECVIPAGLGRFRTSLLTDWKFRPSSALSLIHVVDILEEIGRSYIAAARSPPSMET
ncbi:hypothetical protein GWI33_012488 [Rhynchophorus ferrugineus]|uniref:Uncharacterized protein n=1 Tax=Rhynchophorus ferrugineus TaxID=354439 RepID=A0A834ME54_RHYFE|nr:hypothetical protein GWI33_012488 [Rhynchophorus ferrugineus]